MDPGGNGLGVAAGPGEFRGYGGVRSRRGHGSGKAAGAKEREDLKADGAGAGVGETGRGKRGEWRCPRRDGVGDRIDSEGTEPIRHSDASRWLVDLNAQRAAEERSGVVRWMRPEFQRTAAAQTGLGVEAEEEEAGPARVARAAWPPSLPERVRAVRDCLAQGGVPATGESPS
jgi:hypothetical protein